MEAVNKPSMSYAGFWPRLFALAIDLVVLLGMGLPFWLLYGRTVSMGIFATILGAVVAAAYHVVCVGHWGKTVGKWAAGIVVVARDGKPAGWGRAARRASVDVLFSGLSCVSEIVALRCVSPSVYPTLGWRARAELLTSLSPNWHVWVSWMMVGWGFSEVIVLLTNRERRALHDFIGGTVVIHTRARDERRQSLWSRELI